jgi:hypothetical protein
VPLTTDTRTVDLAILRQAFCEVELDQLPDEHVAATVKADLYLGINARQWYLRQLGEPED